MNEYYKLNKDKTTSPCTRDEFIDQIKDKSRNIGYTEKNKHRISTVFLGIDYNFIGGLPILFETMIFDNLNRDVYQNRYETHEDALDGHQSAVDNLNEIIEENQK